MGHPLSTPPAGNPDGHLGGRPSGHPGGHTTTGSATSTSASKRPHRPGSGPAAKAFEERTGIKAPRIIAWEITRSCNLACAHCRAAAHREPYPGELSLDECKRVMDDIASLTDPILILTGGEPLMRDDIWDIIDYAHLKGLHPVIGTNGTLIDDECARKIAEHGIPRVSVSLDFPTAEGQDEFRGKAGAFDETIAGMRNLRARGVGVQVNTTVTKMNSHLLNEMHDLALAEGAAAFHPFLLVPTGRGEDLLDVELTPDEYEEVLTWAYRCQQTSPLHFKPTDAPQYYRIVRQHAAEPEKAAGGHSAMESFSRGCLGGISFAFISHTGDVQPCGYFDMQLGNVRDIPFSRIWETSPVFDDLRHYERLRGKCGACEYKGICGGCRARALAATGDYLAEEPYCAHIPRSIARKRVLDEIQSDFPLESDPHGMLAERLGLKRDQVIQIIEMLKNDGTIRQICASISSKKLGYTSTLCALAVPGPAANIDRVGDLISAHPEVTHNYLRDAEYNVWFTAIAPSSADLDRLIGDIENETGCKIMNLPVTALYKIRVDFGKQDSANSKENQHAKGANWRQPASSESNSSVDSNGKDLGRAQTGPESKPRPFNPDDPFDVALIRWAQADVVDERPFQKAAQLIAKTIGDETVTEQRVLQRLRELKANGTIRRFGAFVRHQKLGYAFNGMTVWDVDEADARQIGRAFSALPFVSHCYERPPSDSWPYNLYAMVHAKSQDELDTYVAEMSGISGLEPRVLISTKEYKKALPLFFGGPLPS